MNIRTDRKKITTTAGTLESGDKIGRRVVRYSTFREHGLGYHVYFEGSDTPEAYARNEPITVELANPGGWYLRSKLNSLFWRPEWKSFHRERGDSFPDKEAAIAFADKEKKRCPFTKLLMEVVFLQSS